MPFSNTTGHGGTTNYVKTLADGTQVTLAAPEYVGGGQDRKRFTGWTGAVTSEKHNITVSMTAGRAVTANYVSAPEEIVYYTLTVKGSGEELYRWGPMEIQSPTGHGGRLDTGYQMTVVAGTKVTLVAPESPEHGVDFIHWITHPGGTIVSTDRSYTFYMNSDIELHTYYDYTW